MTASTCVALPRAAASEPLLRSHMPELDTIRGIAVLLVLFFHGFYFRHGLHGLSGLPKLLVAMTAPAWMGVNLFFVLSGFLITGILLDSKLKPDYYRKFYLRRALRILPLYYAVLLLLALVSHSGLGIRYTSWAFLAFSFVYLSNVTGLFGVPMQYGVLWSLAVEEHFYLLWPLAVRSLSRRHVIAVAAFICFLCPCLRAFYLIRNFDLGTGYTWLCADGLATGALLASLARGPWGTRVGVRNIGTLLAAAGFAMFAVGYPFGILRGNRFIGQMLQGTALNLIFGGTIALTLVVGTSPWKAWVNRPLLRFYGKISYGLYILHMLVFDAEEAVVRRFLPHLASTGGTFTDRVLLFCAAAALATGISYASRQYFEGFFLQLKQRL